LIDHGDRRVVVGRPGAGYDSFMSRLIQVHLLPDSLQRCPAEGQLAIVLDILRATTTMAHAARNGIRRIVPCGTVEDARRYVSAHPELDCLLGGERGGVLIPGFDLDNSPAGYTPERVAGRTLVMTTTNGTAALLACHGAARVLVGSFAGFGAALQGILEDSREVHLVCAGTNGQVSNEDVLCAGALACAVVECSEGAELPDETRLAMDFFRWNSQNAGTFREALRMSRGGRNLQRLGFERDIDMAAAWHTANVMLEYHPGSGALEPRPMPAAAAHGNWLPDTLAAGLSGCRTH
jgi:2-phosphosulfolactate phosphatase